MLWLMQEDTLVTEPHQTCLQRVCVNSSLVYTSVPSVNSSKCLIISFRDSWIVLISVCTVWMVVQLSLSVHRGLIPGALPDTKIPGVYKMVVGTFGPPDPRVFVYEDSANTQPYAHPCKTVPHWHTSNIANSTAASHRLSFPSKDGHLPQTSLPPDVCMWTQITQHQVLNTCSLPCSLSLHCRIAERRCK